MVDSVTANHESGTNRMQYPAPTHTKIKTVPVFNPTAKLRPPGLKYAAAEKHALLLGSVHEPEHSQTIPGLMNVDPSAPMVNPLEGGCAIRSMEGHMDSKTTRKHYRVLLKQVNIRC
eukprot:CAMPEP_0171319334 /NCGR_PEP_ID=MMETSP0816-20121228/95715_1 /TAXON_ID=420281 /ORGANISM="Proboscia inermis, Strain CCAP1064/1" /LENGTH=116 /DNA_ID=CAMNT_0011814891 /DNA_START=281 /DNA_END=630 /DNA_ORIENTATION=+